jgi:large subunit ribosomal protein L4
VGTHKTRDLVSLLKKNGWTKSVLIIGSDNVTRDLGRAAQNLPGVTVLPHYETNVYDILRHEKLIMSVNAVNFLERLFKKDPLNY